MVNEPDGGYYLLSVIHENPYVTNIDSLYINRLNLNLIILSDSFGFGEGSIESDDGPLNASTK